MTAPAHGMTDGSRTRPSARAVQTRLPWWGAVLPALGFALLLVLLVGAGRADAAEQTADSPLVSFLVHLWSSLPG
nr:hypothetical protein [Streptomyces reniochalinae]